MKFHPILFSSPMVQALLNKTKSQTRRKLKFKGCIKAPINTLHSDFILCGGIYDAAFDEGEHGSCQDFETLNKEWMNYAKTGVMVGDVFWVRETFAEPTLYDGFERDFYYKADDPEQQLPTLHFDKWKPCIFMPKAAARIFLKVTKIRVEMVSEISDADILAEGIKKHIPVPGDGEANLKLQFKNLWDKINGPITWTNWVWVYDFKIIDKPKNFK